MFAFVYEIEDAWEGRKGEFRNGRSVPKAKGILPHRPCHIPKFKLARKKRLLFRDRNQMISGHGAGCSDPRLLTRSCFRIRLRRIAAVSVSFAGSGDSQAA